MKVIYEGPDDRVHIPGVGKFDAGEIEVPDEIGRALVKTHPHYRQAKAAAKKKDGED